MKFLIFIVSSLLFTNVYIILLGLFVTFCLKLSMVPIILILLISAISVFSICARLALLSAPMLALLYVSCTVWLLFRTFLSFLMFHDCLAHSFWNFVSSIFVLILHSLTVPMIPELDLCFMWQFGWMWALLWFPKLVRIHNVNLLGI